MNITDEMIEAAGREVGMAHGGWGEVNPRELMDAIWRVLCAAKASEGEIPTQAQAKMSKSPCLDAAMASLKARWPAAKTP